MDNNIGNLTITKPDKHNLVTKSNRLIEASYKLLLNECRVLNTIISCVQPQDEDFAVMRFNLFDMARICDVEVNHARERMEEVTKTLMTRVITFNEDGKTIQTHWVQRAEYKDNMIEFELDPGLKPYLLNLKGRFTEMKLSELLRLGNSYAIRIFEILYQYKTIGERYVTVDEFKNMLDIKEGEYSTFGLLKQKIIEPVVKAINTRSEMSVSYTLKKDGRAYVGILFKIRIKAAMKSKKDENEAKEKLYAVMGEEKAEAAIEEYGLRYCLANLEYTIEKNPKKPKAYLHSALIRNYANYYEAFALPKEKKEKICPICGGKGIINRTRNDGTGRSYEEVEICSCQKKKEHHK